MLDQAGFVEIICREDQTAEIARVLIEGMAALYADSCGCRVSKLVKEYVSHEICPIWQTPDGIYAELMDIQSGCLSLSDHFLGKNSYYDSFEYDSNTTYEHVLFALFDRYPGISLRAEITISYHYSEDRYECYYTDNGELFWQAAEACNPSENKPPKRVPLNLDFSRSYHKELPDELAIVKESLAEFSDEELIDFCDGYQVREFEQIELDENGAADRDKLAEILLVNAMNFGGEAIMDYKGVYAGDLDRFREYIDFMIGYCFD